MVVLLNGVALEYGVDFIVEDCQMKDCGVTGILTFIGPLCGPRWLRRALSFMQPRLSTTDVLEAKWRCDD